MSLAAINWYQLGTVVALLLTGVTGVVAYYASRRTAGQQADAAVVTRRAELAKIEVMGWESLIKTLSAQYDLSQKDVIGLRAEQASLTRRIEELVAEVQRLRDEVERLTEELQRTREERDRLWGRQGPKGERGPQGKQGPRGTSGGGVKRS